MPNSNQKHLWRSFLCYLLFFTLLSVFLMLVIFIYIFTMSSGAMSFDRTLAFESQGVAFLLFFLLFLVLLRSLRLFLGGRSSYRLLISSFYVFRAGDARGLDWIDFILACRWSWEVFCHYLLLFIMWEWVLQYHIALSYPLVLFVSLSPFWHKLLVATCS